MNIEMHNKLTTLLVTVDWHKLIDILAGMGAMLVSCILAGAMTWAALAGINLYHNGSKWQGILLVVLDCIALVLVIAFLLSISS